MSGRASFSHRCRPTPSESSSTTACSAPHASFRWRRGAGRSKGAAVSARTAEASPASPSAIRLGAPCKRDIVPVQRSALDVQEAEEAPSNAFTSRFRARFPSRRRRKMSRWVVASLGAPALLSGLEDCARTTRGAPSYGFEAFLREDRHHEDRGERIGPPPAESGVEQEPEQQNCRQVGAERRLL